MKKKHFYSKLKHMEVTDESAKMTKKQVVKEFGGDDWQEIIVDYDEGENYDIKDGELIKIKGEREVDRGIREAREAEEKRLKQVKESLKMKLGLNDKEIEDLGKIFSGRI